MGKTFASHKLKGGYNFSANGLIFLLFEKYNDQWMIKPLDQFTQNTNQPY